MSDETTTPSAARTTGLVSFSLAVADLDRARDFYVDVLGFEVRGDREPWPGARMIEVAPPGSAIGLVLLPKGSDIPLAVRMTTDDAETAHRVLRGAGAKLHNKKVLHMGDMPPMFHFDDLDGNGLVYIERTDDA